MDSFKEYWANVMEQSEREKGESLRRFAVIERSKRRGQEQRRRKRLRRRPRTRIEQLLWKLERQLDRVRKEHQKRKAK